MSTREHISVWNNIDGAGISISISFSFATTMCIVYCILLTVQITPLMHSCIRVTSNTAGLLVQDELLKETEEEKTEKGQTLKKQLYIFIHLSSVIA